ncbi:MAG: amidohydrolase family protein, partial [Herpetosiphonaceae bacterium]|nr:amidohydrolase family protein [Herpetosiphonaceae bacterium]
VTLAPELPGALAAIPALTAKGIVVSAGHSDATFAEAEAGHGVGIRWGTHLFNAMHPLHHREPGLAAHLLLAALPCGIIVDGVHVHPAMVRLALRTKGVDGLTLVSDAMAAMGMPPGTYPLADRTVFVDTTSARLADGTLAGSILTMDQAVRNMQSFTGCSLAEALQMASTVPARLLGLAQKGVLAPGNDADIVVLDHAQVVTHTFVAGRLVFERAGA